MKFFSPTKRFLNKLSYSKKFTLIGLLLIIPLLMMNVLYLDTIKAELKEKSKQLEGSDYNMVLKDILQYTQQARGLNVKILNGDVSAQDSLVEVTKKVETSFDEIKALESTMKYDLNATKARENIENNWDTLQSTKWTNAADVLTSYGEVVSDEITLIRDVANNSGLLLADSKEDYNMIYNANIELPQLTEKLGQMRALGVTIIKEGKYTEEHEAQIEQLYYPTLIIIQNMQESMKVSMADKEFADALTESTEAATNSTTDYLTQVNQLATMKISADDYYALATKSIDDNFESFNKMFTVIDSEIEDEYASKSFMQKGITVVITLISLLSIVLFISLYLSMKEAILTLRDKTAEVAEGNLNVEIDLQTKDELHDVELSFNRMTNNLHHLVEAITTNSNKVASSSEELNASAEEASATVENSTTAANQVARDTDSQVNSLQESSRAMEDMVVGIEKIADNSQRISKLTNETTASAIDGNETVEKALNQMTMIKETVTMSSEKIHELNKQSEKIGSIVQVITGIADQTNLLALNAAIEAARAGEHGKGFAVVADEVRKLAEESRSSAAQITELIKVVQVDTVESVQMMDNVTNNVAVGIEVTEDASAKFNHILLSMEVLNPQMAEISTTAMEFSAHAEQVAAAMKQLLETSQQTSAATEEIASSSEEQLAIMEEVAASANALSEMADSLQQLITNFKL